MFKTKATSLLAVLVLAIQLPLLASVTLAQTPDALAPQLDQLEQSLQEAQTRIERPWAWRGALPNARKEVTAIITEADRLQLAAQELAVTQKQLLEALGPKPEEGAKEAEDIVNRRAMIEEKLSLHEADTKRGRLLKARAGELRDTIDDMIAQARARSLLDRERNILEPSFWLDTGESLRKLSDHAASDERPSRSLPEFSPRAFALILVGLLLACAIARAVSRSGFASDSSSEARRFLRAIAAALPAVLLTIVIDGLRQAALISVTLGDILVIGATSLGLVMFATALAQGAAESFTLNPSRRSWRLFVAIASTIGLIFFLSRMNGAVLHAPGLFPAGQFLLGCLISLLALAVAQRRLLESGQQSSRSGTSLLAAARHSRARPWLTLLRLATWVVLTVWITYPVLFALGYRNLSDWLLFGTSGTLLAVITCLYLALAYRLACDRFVMRVLRPFMLTHMGRRLGFKRSRLLRFWTITMLDLLMLPAAIALLAMIWGFDLYRPVEWLQALGEEIRIGSMVLTLQDVAWALALAVILLLITKVVQKVLEQRILPSLDVSEGPRSAMVSMTGYLGVGLALVAGLATLQIDFSKIVVVAGALSVGIGFGLQHVANNFISGLIMLIERPVNVGDWVVVNGQEGMVRRIRVRATEIQTFQKASVLVPNSDLVSGTVTNWTLKDRTTRIEIRIGVSFDCDVELVERLLLDCAGSHPDTLSEPPPRAVLFNFGENALEFELWAYIDTAEVTRKTMVESDIRKRIICAFNSHQVPWPVAQRDVHVTHTNAAWTQSPSLAKPGF
ncbi:mechanosensitive ion channel domain-containing protein [Limibacillus halophilus]|uniref:Small-conductance mechanosensitive channel n=1 Tax=Limibacillus halophilus TaxID=1579333 RepID=A0A839SUY3_9PROT|nr:mechanosensitive ion channel domain-containing protein [Limibacillus halophilus]MBB3064753.1 small-conductance mechanosensitive channel [Limibacillus halophilus]